MFSSSYFNLIIIICFYTVLWFQVFLFIGGLNIHGYIKFFNIQRTHVTANNSTNNNVLFCLRFENSILEQLLILDPNALDKRRKIFCVTIYLVTKSFKPVQAKFNNYPQKSQISSHRVSKQPQQGGRKSQIKQEVDCKMSWQCACGERFCRKESKKVPPKPSKGFGVSRA